LLLRKSRREDEEEFETEETEPEKDPAEAVILKIDAAADLALEEINRMSRLVLDETEKKYQAVLFLYDLLEAKRKEIVALTENPAAMVSVKPHPISGRERLKQETPKQTSRPDLRNKRNERIYALFDEGVPLLEIARELNMGQGEVKLILDLTGRQT
jgi:DNA-directed RNA polymerase specialized sigma24 family protein